MFRIKKVMLKELRLLQIIRNIEKEKYKNDNWMAVLSDIADLFYSDSAYLAMLNGNYVECKTSYIIHNSSFQYDSMDLKIRNIESAGAASETIKSRKPVLVDDYSNYAEADKNWQETDIKSLISVPVENNRLYGALQVASSAAHYFDPNDLKLLHSIADTIAVMLDKDELYKKNARILELNEKQMEFISNLNISKEFKTPYFKKWLSNALNRVRSLVDSTAVGFILPDEDIYTFCGDKDYSSVSFEVNDQLKDTIIYKIWQMGIDKPISHEELAKYNIKASEMSKHLNIKSAFYVPIRYKKKVIAIVAFGFDKDMQLGKEHINYLRAVGNHIVFSILSSKGLSKMSTMLSKAEESLVKVIMSVSEMRDKYTKGHSDRVAYYAKKIAEAIGLDYEQQSYIYTAGLLHDIGKVGIPDNILLKPGKLTNYEYKIMKYHAVFSYDIVKDVEQLRPIAECIKEHHERCDGSGYPDGLHKEQLTQGGRILAIADVFDALTSDRIYRSKSKYGLNEAIDMLKNSKLDNDILEQSMDVLCESYLNETNDEYENIVFKEIDDVRKIVFTKDFMTGTERLTTLMETLRKYIQKQKHFYLFVVDIKSLNYINYMKGPNIGNILIEYTAQALNAVKDVSCITRSGSDSFLFIYNKENIGSFIPQLNISLDKNILNLCRHSKIDIDDVFKGFYITYVEYPKDSENSRGLVYLCERKLRRIKMKALENEE